ncbi:MAG: hypothetical protein WCF88_19625 [Candidatus Acidiferrales bacterium]|jgi:hypothetical protein
MAITGASPDLLIGRERELHRLRVAIQKRDSQLLWGLSDAGKTFLIRQAIAGLPEAERRKCIYWTGAATGRQLVSHFLRGLFIAGDPVVRRKVHADRAGEFTLNHWLNKQSLLRLRGILFSAAEHGDYRFFVDHLSSPTHKMAHLLKEIIYRCKTPVYLTGHGYSRREIGYAWSLYWTDECRIRLEPLVEAAARELLEMCISNFGLTSLDLAGFREEILHFSERLPGSIVKMCELAADSRYHYGHRVKLKLVHVDYLMRANRLAMNQTPTFAQ